MNINTKLYLRILSQKKPSNSKNIQINIQWIYIYRLYGKIGEFKQRERKYVM